MAQMLQVTLDTSCVVNLLSVREQSDPALLRLMRLALDSRVHIAVTEVVDDEVPEGDGREEVQRRAYARQNLQQFPVVRITSPGRAECDVLASEFLAVLWPNAAEGSGKYENSLQDSRHLACHRMCGRDIFITRDLKLLRKAQAHRDKLGVEVLAPVETLARVEPEPSSSSSVDEWDPVVRPARDEDRGKIKALLAPIRGSYDDFDAWLGGALTKKELWIAELDENVGAVAVWSKKTEATVKLATFFVGDDYRGRALGPHLLFHQLRHWIGLRISKVFVTVSSERLEALSFFLDYGFRIEGVSARRYKSTAVEFILAKHLFYEVVADDKFDAFTRELGAQVFDLPAHSDVRSAASWFLPPNYGELSPIRDRKGAVTHVEVVCNDENRRQISLAQLEELVYPARLSLHGRKAYMIPIRRAWADRLMHLPDKQMPLLKNKDKLALRTDNTYYCHPCYEKLDVCGAPALFYVSGRDKMVAGFARIVERRIDEPEELYLRYERSGIYSLDDIRGHMKKSGPRQGCSMAIRFAWWVPFAAPVSLEQLRGMGLHHPQRIQAIDYADYEMLLEAGGVNW